MNLNFIQELKKYLFALENLKKRNHFIIQQDSNFAFQGSTLERRRKFKRILWKIV